MALVNSRDFTLLSGTPTISLIYCLWCRQWEHKDFLDILWTAQAGWSWNAFKIRFCSHSVLSAYYRHWILSSRVFLLSGWCSQPYGGPGEYWTSLNCLGHTPQPHWIVCEAERETGSSCNTLFTAIKNALVKRRLKKFLVTVKSWLEDANNDGDQPQGFPGCSQAPPTLYGGDCEDWSLSLLRRW